MHMFIIEVELQICLLAVNQDAREMTEQFIILTFETYGVRTGSCIIMKNRRTEENQKWGQKSLLFLRQGAKESCIQAFSTSSSK